MGALELSRAMLHYSKIGLIFVFLFQGLGNGPRLQYNREQIGPRSSLVISKISDTSFPKVFPRLVQRFPRMIDPFVFINLQTCQKTILSLPQEPTYAQPEATKDQKLT